MIITDGEIKSAYERGGGKAVRKLCTLSEQFPNGVNKIHNLISGTDVFCGAKGEKLIVPGSNTQLGILFKEFFGNVGAGIESYPKGADIDLGGKFAIFSPNSKYGGTIMGDFLDFSKFKKVIDYMERKVTSRKEYIFSARPTEEVAMRSLRQFIKHLK